MMATTGTTIVPLLLAFTTTCSPSFGAAQETLTVTKGGTTFEVDWYDDARENPYTVSFRHRRADSLYSFDALGVLRQLDIDDVTYTFSYAGDETMAVDDGSQSIVVDDIGSRMLRETRDGELEIVQMHDEGELYGIFEAAVGFHHRRRLYACHDCEQTWDTVCDCGIDTVCDLVPTLGSRAYRRFWTRDAKRSIRVMCRKFGKACRTSGERTCRGQCTDGEPA